MSSLELTKTRRNVQRAAQRRMVIVLSGAFVALAVFFAQQSLRLADHRPWLWFSASGAVVFAVILALALRRGSGRAVSALFCGALVVLVGAAGARGGLYLLSGPWSLCIALLTAFLLSPRWGAAVGLGYTLEALVLARLGALGGDASFFAVPRPSSVLVSQAVTTAIAVLLTVLYDRMQRRTVDELVRVMREFEATHDELDRTHRELQAMHRQAIGQEKLSSLGLVAAGVAHEINNPMSYVASNVNSLRADFDALLRDEALFREYRDEVLPATQDGIRRVNAIVADLRRFARGDPESLVEYSLDEQVESAARIVRPQFRDGATLELKLGKPPPALGRPGQIVQVVLNLLVNARQALRGVGTVTVETTTEGEHVVLSVRDTGIGMTEEIRARVFEPFFTTKPVGEGTGLGLPVVHGIVRDHAGTIEVLSAPGAGSRFTVRLPLIPHPAVLSAA